MQNVQGYFPTAVNSGGWLTRYTLDQLKQRVEGTRVVLPICSLGTPAEQLEALAPLVLPPLYHEALDADLKQSLLDRIRFCFPYYHGTQEREETTCEFEIVELPAQRNPPPSHPKILAFSVDTAVEEHGPHLPLMTDTIQSYGVLGALEQEHDGFLAGPPLEYGHLTWGLPFGVSIDVTPPLLTRYVTGYANAIDDWLSPESVYVVDVHGSIVHRRAIEAGLEQSRLGRWTFRWLHEPLVEFAADRGDQHAGGVETILVEKINPALLDSNWWPGRIEEITAGEMNLEQAVQLSADLPKFMETVAAEGYNGIVGNIRNYFDLDAEELFERMMRVAREDVLTLTEE